MKFRQTRRMRNWRNPTIVNIPITMVTPVATSGPLLITGTLRILPTELMVLVCQSLDVKSCIRFRQVSRLYRELVSDMLEYKVVVREAPHLVTAGLCAGFAEWFTFGDMYRPMCLTQCEICGKLGPRIYLLHAVRCCRKCLLEDERFHTYTLVSFAQWAMLSEETIRKAGVRVFSSNPERW